jgi:enoyl-CoA hydratase/carnithine racemase
MGSRVRPSLVPTWGGSARLTRCVVTAGEWSLADALAEERRAVLATLGTKDQQEGMRTFLEK